MRLGVLKRRMWVSLKVTFLLVLVVIEIVAFWQVLTGERPSTRYAASGLFVLPIFAFFYVVRFSEIRLTSWSVLSHLIAIASVVFIGSCLYLHNTDPPAIDAARSPFLLLICATIFTFAFSVGAIAHFAGYKLFVKRDRGTRTEQVPPR